VPVLKAAGLKMTKSRGTDNTRIKIKGVAVPVHFVPYARVNKRSQTIGHNTGAKIPGTKKRRIVTGRVCQSGVDFKKKTAVDRFTDKGVQRRHFLLERDAVKLKRIRA
jgi:hypothetical protein